MGILTDLARQDISKLSNLMGDTISINDGVLTADVKGFISKHNLAYSPDTGLPVNSVNIHFCVTESNLLAAGFTVRDGNNKINMIDWFVTFSDSSLANTTYQIKEIMPSQTTGLIVCTLNIYNG